MKKLFVVIALGAFAACGTGKSENASKDSAINAIDSTKKVATDSIKTAADSAKSTVDSTAKAAKDSVKKS